MLPSPTNEAPVIRPKNAPVAGIASSGFRCTITLVGCTPRNARRPPDPSATLAGTREVVRRWPSRSYTTWMRRPWVPASAARSPRKSATGLPSTATTRSLARGRRGAVVGLGDDLLDHVGGLVRRPADHREQQEDEQQRGDEVGDRAGGQDDRPLPGRLVAELALGGHGLRGRVARTPPALL